MLEPGGGGGGTPTSGDGLVCPAAFPAKSEDLDTGKIRESAEALRRMGRQVQDRVEDIDGSWARLQSHYEAPEEHRVYTVLDPAVSSAEDLQGTLRRAAHHLDAYALELDRVKPRLKELETEAQKFRVRVIDGVPVDASEAADPSFGDYAVGAIDSVYGALPRFGPIGDGVEERQVIVPWDQDSATYEENNALVARYNRMYEEISTAATSCANGINDLVEGRTPKDLDPVRAEALSVPGKPMPWGHPVDEERNCAEAVGHGTKRGVGNWKDAGVGLATLAVGYNPDTHVLGDRDYQGQAWAGLGSTGFSTAVTVAASKAPALKDVEWVRRHEDVVKSVYGEEVGYDHQAEMAGGDGLHEWHDDPLAMGTTLAWSVVPALLSGGLGAGVKGAAAAGRAVPNGLKRPTRSTGDVLAALARGDGMGRAAAGGPMKGATLAFPSGALGGKAVNALDAALRGGGPKGAPRPVSESINIEPSTTARGHGSESGATPGSGDRGAGQASGSGVEPRRTVSHKEAPSPWTPDDVRAARERAGGVDHRTGEPLRPDGPNGERRWHMKWDPEAREWVAENPGQGHTDPSTSSGAREGRAKIGSFTVPDDAVRVTSGSKGGWEHSLYNPEPNTTYVVDDKFAYVTDDLGRVEEAHGILEDAPRDGAGHRQTRAGGVDRLGGDEGGHIFGKRLGGPGEDINLLAMARDANRSQYAKLENQWRALLKGDNPPKIEVTVRPVYEGDSQRPSRMLVQWTEDGVRRRDVVIWN